MRHKQHKLHKVLLENGLKNIHQSPHILARFLHLIFMQIMKRGNYEKTDPFEKIS